MIDKIFTLSDGTTIETSIVGNATITRQEGPGYYSYKELAPMGPEYYPKRNGIKVHYWIILIPAEKLTKTIEWLKRRGVQAKGYGKYIKIDWNTTKLFASEQDKLKRQIKNRLAEIYRPQ